MAKKELINEDEYPSNSKSRRSAPMREVREEREERPILKRTISGRAVRRKQSLTQSIAQTLAGNGEGQSVIEYILQEVLIPAAKATIQQMVEGGIEMLLFGETRGGRSRGRDRDRSTVSYGSYYRSKDDDRPKARARDRFDLNEIYFRNGDEAAEVLDKMCDLLEEYEQVTVADFFDLAGIDGATWAHNKYGWENLKKARCTHTRHGYLILFPDPIELDD